MTDTHVVIPHAEASKPLSIMHPLVEKMMATNPTPEALGKMLELQRQWEKDEAKRAFDAALVELKRAMPRFLGRDKTVDYPGKSGGRTYYTHTSLAHAMEIVTPHLVDHGFSLAWETESTANGSVKVSATLTHRLGHSKTNSLIAPPDGGGNKNPVQAVASTVTLLERYTALALLGLSTADMTEPTGEGAPRPADSAGRVDTARNMRAMSDLAKRGKSKPDVEKFLGKPLNQWTTADLDKLRAWLDAPAPAPAEAPPAAPVGDRISKGEVENLTAIEKKYQLTSAQFGAIVIEEIGRTPKGRADLRKPEYEKVVKLFAAVEAGAVDLRSGKIVRPIEPGADVGEEQTFDKYDPEKPDEIPF